MASLAVPLITAIAPEIITLIAGLVHKQAPVAEAANGPSTGPVKFADVFGAVITALTSAAAAGQIPKQLPSNDIVKVVIQAVVSSMKLGGLLGMSVPELNARISAGFDDGSSGLRRTDVGFPVDLKRKLPHH